MINRFIFIALILIIHINMFAQNNQDSITNVKIEKLNRSIDSLQKQIDFIKQEKDYFTQAIDSQKSGFSDILQTYTNIIALIFGLAGIITFAGTYLKLKFYQKEIGKTTNELTQKFNKIEQEFFIYKNESSKILGLVYLVHSNSLPDDSEKDRFLVLIKVLELFINGKYFDENFSVGMDNFLQTSNKMQEQNISLNVDEYNEIFNKITKFITNLNDLNVDNSDIDKLKQVLIHINQLVKI